MDRSDREAALKTLSTFEEQRKKLDAVISALRSLLDLPAEGSPAQITLASVEVSPHTPYAAMPVLKAALAYLSAVNRPAKAPEIARALRKGGQPSTAKAFTNTVYSRLYLEAKKPGSELERGPDGSFVLKDWRLAHARRQTA
jgi:hypothetical protein